VAGKIYQTLPLYENLKTTGVYIYPEAIDLGEENRRCEGRGGGRNETGDYAAITLSAVVVDADGVVRAKLDGNTSDLVGGPVGGLHGRPGTLANARLWDVNDPYLYASTPSSP
jgi:beta-galactosidase